MKSVVVFFTPRLLAVWVGIFLVMATVAAPAQDAAETLVELQTVGGLRFDPPRFAVEPGAKLKVVIDNKDDMAHNFVLTAPGARAEVVNLAMAMPFTPTSDFIPKTDKVLQHSPVLLPGKRATLSFTAPSKEGVYPFVCTYPGHGVIMYGAMYVTKAPMPPLAKDENLPETVRQMGEMEKLHAYKAEPPFHYRIFMRDSGPASIAVALPGGQNYCWDAGSCRLRYAWTGAFVDPMPHWSGNGDAFAEVKGRIYYRAPAGVPLRVGAKDKVPAVKFLGYRLVQRYPEFHYLVDGMEVRELIKAPHHGNGLEISFTIANPTAPVFYVADPAGGGEFKSPEGAFKQGVLQLDAAKAAKFSVSISEIPGREPLRYWSMNDTLPGKKTPVVDGGVIGRAISFDGVKQEAVTGLKTDALQGGTVAMWVKAREQKARQKKGEAGSEPAAADQVVFGGRVGGDEWGVGWNLGGAKGLGIVTRVGGVESLVTHPAPLDFKWHHVAATFGADGFTFYVDGTKVGAGAGVLPPRAPLFFGSAGGVKFSSALVDEARLDDRILSPAEIAALVARDRARATGIEPSAP